MDWNAHKPNSPPLPSPLVRMFVPLLPFEEGESDGVAEGGSFEGFEGETDGVERGCFRGFEGWMIK